MDERLLTRLREAGMEGEVSAQLLHGDAAFALSADQLGYVDAAGARTVALKDINRIHSDREGLLRVESQGGTAITASLLGFDPAGVQAFFNQVRTNTNQAKTLPQTAIPQPSGNPWKSGWTSSQPRPEGASEAVAEPGAAAVTPGPINPPAGPAPVPPAPVAATLQPVTEGETTRPVVISTTPRFNPEPTQPTTKAPAPQAPVAKNPPVNSGAKSAKPAVAGATSPAGAAPAASDKADKAQDARARLLQREQANAEAAERRGGAKPAAPPRPTPPDTRAQTRQTGVASLQALAEGVSGLISTLRLLAVAMGLAAILVGVLRFRENDPVTGLWIIGSGLVAAFALVVFAQVARLLVGIAQRLQQDA